MMKKVLRLLSYVLVAAIATLATLYWVNVNQSTKLQQLSGIIQSYYVEDIDPVEVEDAAAHGMISALSDRWSYYIPSSEYATYMEQSENAYVGVGITILQQEDGKGFEIIAVEADGPAYEAGIRIQDVLVGVQGQDVTQMTATGVRNLVRGEEGTYVDLTVLRQGQELTFSVERRTLQMTVAEGELLEGGIGLITIYNFDDRCASESISRIEELRAQGADKLIFDVRNNGGGYAHEMVELLDYLLPEGDLFRTVNYAGKENVDTSDANYLDLPMAVLVNAESYSAAEFFAAALREYDAAIVVGEQTSGKGYFQNTFSLNDGSAVALSTGRYYTPKGECLEGVGITPDIPVEVDEETYAGIYYGTVSVQEDPQLQAAMEALEK